ncbi:MAG TPA: gamma-glutamylcyclotransferase family protein [Symbiobacteriaceae bacterium]|nr:gamma-glutamylcyclotransferase family protein [Symbiobacteriaceae bacterium]
MQNLGETSGRVLLHLYESGTGLTEAELELRAGAPVAAELTALITDGIVQSARERYFLTDADEGSLGIWAEGELSRLSRSGVLYFAYGSNMDPWQVYRGPAPVCASARFLCRAALPGYRVTFPRQFPLWVGCVAGVVPAPGESVWGVLYAVDDAGWAALDRFERVPDDYSRVAVTVSVPLRGSPAPLELAAQTYVHVPDGSEGGLPAASYMERIRRGARAFALPPRYLAWLDGVETIRD